MKLHLDFETRSAVDLTKVGAWAYALHPSTEILCAGLCYFGKDVSCFDGRDLMIQFPNGLAPDGIISAHNAAFEYAIYHCILHRRYGWPSRVDPKLWSCTMARAAMVGLPLDLDSLGRVLQIKTPKDLNGRRIMHQLCKPNADGQYDTDPAKLAQLYAYNRTDVQAEMEVDALLPELSASERRVWELDLVMNRRGVQIDTKLAARAAGLSGQIVTDLNTRLFQMTGGAVSKASRIGEIKQFLLTNGVTVPTKTDAEGEDKETLDKAAMLELLGREDLPQKVRDVVAVRQQVGKSTSTAKYAKALEMVCRDGRIRGSLQYHAAHTGRWGGRLLQPQNFPKGFNTEDQNKSIALILNGTAEDFIGKYGTKSMDALSDSLRGLIVSGPQKQLISADFNAIEARVLFWLAGDEAALNTYRRGESPYLDMANYIYNRTDITKKGSPKEYDLGKRTILGAGFGMGAVKFKVTCKIQANIDITDELAARAISAYREKFPAVPRLWREIEAAAINAVKTPGVNYAAANGKLLWGMSLDRRFLVCRLPSGRFLWYWKPIVRMGKTPWGEEKEEMCYQGEDPKTKQWGLIKTYGGALTENPVQAVARDLMVAAMLRVEAAGYEMLLTIHDELLAETTNGNLEDFTSLMCRLEPWAEGCPVAAEGWIGGRYRK